MITTKLDNKSVPFSREVLLNSLNRWISLAIQVKITLLKAQALSWIHLRQPTKERLRNRASDLLSLPWTASFISLQINRNWPVLLVSLRKRLPPQLLAAWWSKTTCWRVKINFYKVWEAGRAPLDLARNTSQVFWVVSAKPTSAARAILYRRLRLSVITISNNLNSKPGSTILRFKL